MSDLQKFEELANEGPVDSGKILRDDEILTEEELKKKPEDSAECGESKTDKPKKACANCTCGLADQLEKEAKDATTNSSDSAGKSSCGSCYLGDAFRCASCPYRGMPAFKPAYMKSKQPNATTKRKRKDPSSLKSIPKIL